MKTRIKKILPIVLAISMMLCSMVLCTTVVDFGGFFTPVASAADAGDLVVTNFGDGTCWINCFSKTGEVDDVGELIIPEKIGNMTVTGINKNAFKGRTELTKVVIPDTVTTIEFSAFQGCTGLESVVMGNNVTYIGSSAFNGCTKLSDITIPDTVTTLGSGAFYNTAYYNDEANWENGMLYLENYLLSANKTVSGEVVIKEGTTLMAGGLFKDNKNITKVTIPGSLSVVSGSAFYNCSALTEVVLLEGVKEIGKNAFWNCPKLVKMTIPASIQKFNSGALGNTRVKEPYYNGTVDQWISIEFDSYGDNPAYTAKTLYINGEQLTEAVISVPIVKEYAFKNCQTLEKVTFTDSVVEIQDSAFSDNYYLKEIELGKNIKEIGFCAFQNCSRIEKVTTTMDVNEWSQIDFYDWRSNPVAFAGNLYINGELLENAVFSGITAIKPHTFYGCDSIKSISIPNTVQVIGKSAFGGTSIEELVLPEGVIMIEDNAFENNQALKSVTLPSTLKTVGMYAFERSTNINYVNYNGTIEQWVSIGFWLETSNPVYYSKNLHINGELVENIVIENVEGVCAYAFINCESLKTVYIADGVTAISRSAFEGCSNLESVDLPNTLTTFGDKAFSRCSNLKKVNYRGTIDEWATIDFFSEASNPVYYSRCLYLNDVLLENAVIKEAGQIKNYTFVRCNSIKTLVVGGNTKTIRHAFEKCEGLTSVEIQESVTSIGVKAFIYCTALVDLHISEEGENLPLSSEAFYGCSALEQVVLPKRITRLGNSTFKKCTSLKIVYMSKDIKSVGYDAFYDCPSLEIVYYESDEEQYAAIQINNGNEALLTAETHYNVHDIESHYTTITVEATCTEDGSITKSCPCGYSSFTIIHASNHKPILVNHKDATCTEDGYTGDTVCEACAEVFEQGSVIACTGHSGGTATCSELALCEKCNQYYGETLPHSYTNDIDGICDECGFEREVDIPQTPEQDDVQDTEQDIDQNDAQNNVQNDVQNNVQDNAQKPVQDNVQKPVKDDEQNSVQNPVQKPTQNNVQKPVQNNEQSTVADNSQNDVENTPDKTPDDTTQNTVQDKVQNDDETPKSNKAVFVVAGLALAVASLFLCIFVIKKRKTTK